MNSDSENFDSLRRLLALKRHEQPPPGYFNGFSRDVMARIRAGENGEGETFKSSLLSRLVGMFDVKPAFAGAFGTAVCGLLVVGVISSERLVANNATTPEPAYAAAPEPAYFTPNTSAPSVADNGSFDTSSTNSGSSESLFTRFAPPDARQVSYRYLVPGGVSTGN